MATKEADVVPEEEKSNLTIPTPISLKGQICVEGAARGHNISKAGLEILKLGLPLYLKKFKVKHKLSAVK